MLLAASIPDASTYSSTTWSTKLYFDRLPFTATLNPKIAILAFTVSKSTLPKAAAGIVPVILAPGILVKLAADPVNDVAVTMPEETFKPLPSAIVTPVS